MRIYKNLIPPIIETLAAIFEAGKPANRFIEQVLRSNRKWGSRDRRFIGGQIYEQLRWYRRYYEIALGKPPQSKEDWWAMLAAAWMLHKIELPDWPEIQQIDTLAIWKRAEQHKNNIAIQQSIPDWLHDRGEKELGPQLWQATITALNEPTHLVLRANSLKTSRKKLLIVLKKQGIIGTAIGNHEAILVEGNPRLTHLSAYKDGLFEIQDYASQQVARLLKPTPGSWVIDACAGAGGKSLHLAALMQNRGTIKAMDIRANKLKELQKRAQRAGATCIQTALIRENMVFEPAEHNSTDFLLLDAPCSGTGVLRRNPDAKWRLSNAFIDDICSVQRHILEEYALLCKPGAKMVYATCSVLPSENDQQIQWFLKKTAVGQHFELLQDHQIRPQDQGFDGFYMALLKKQSH